MKTLISIFLLVPAILPKGNAPGEMYNDSGVAIAAFFAFILIIYLVLSPDKTKNSRIRSK